jgi:FdhD protein
MKYQPKRLRRLDRVWINGGQPTYFITICTDQRKRVLATDAVHMRLQQFLCNTTSQHDWWAGRYVLMPDHLHLLATPGLGAVTLGEWIKALKACVGNREFKWQTGFFDHVLRSSESQSEKWEYVRRNPERSGLVTNADDWPFAGEFDWAQGEVGNRTPPRQETRPTTATSSSVEIARHDTSRGFVSCLDELAMEEPLEIRVEGHSIAVVMRTPGHDRELAAGFALTEGLVRHRSDIFEISSCLTNKSKTSNVVNIALTHPDRFDESRFTRHIFTSSSCGICGKATIDAALQQFPSIKSAPAIQSKTLLELPTKLSAAQDTFQRTGGLHACALFNCDGELMLVREDVGRHNALDKLIGHYLLDQKLPLADYILLLSGRVSFEMTQKALAAGIAIIAAISAPTSLAVEFARANNQTLVGFLRGETMNVYAGKERLL